MELLSDFRSLTAEHRRRSVLFVACMAAALAGCGRAGAELKSTRARSDMPLSSTADTTTADTATPAEPLAQDPADPLVRLDLLRKQGRFEEFVNGALNAAEEMSAGESAPRPDLQLLKTEALLAVGRNREAEAAAQGAAILSLDAANAPLGSRALKLWATARLRQRQPFDDSLVTALLAKLPRDDPDAQTVRFWCDSFAQRTPYELGYFSDGASDAMPAEIRPARGPSGTLSAELNAIEARANDTALPLVFIDTGAQHTLMTVGAAQAAGVAIGSSETILIGFSGLKARPGVIDALQLGSLTLRNVPVLVGNAAPLMTAGGQMALGTELMHHVRFTLDYPGRRVLAEPADRPRVDQNPQPRYEIPLWTFSQACLARGQMPGGNTARVLIDTGDNAGTFVASRWARLNFPGLAQPNAALVFKYKHRGLVLDTMELGGYTLHDWPVVDRLPRELERLDLVDVLVGRDLLGKYQVTIDLAQRVLQLQGEQP